MSIFSGQSVFIWNVAACSGGFQPNNPQAWDHIVRVIRLAGLSFAPVKVANGFANFNYRKVGDLEIDDVLPGLFAAFEAEGLPKIGWHYLYGYDPIREAEVAAEQIARFGLDTYILDPEKEFKRNGAVAARQFMNRLRKHYPNLPLALCTYRYPTYHHDFPWTAFLDSLSPENGDVHMPQVYWVADYRKDGPGQQLLKSAAQLKALKELPVVPVGAAYGQRYQLRYWAPTPEQMVNFLTTAKDMRCPGVSWWAWDSLVAKDAASPGLDGQRGWWKVIANQAVHWPVETAVPSPSPSPTLAEQLDSLAARIDRLEAGAAQHGWPGFQIKSCLESNPKWEEALS